jgi:hypothetical protein
MGSGFFLPIHRSAMDETKCNAIEYINGEEFICVREKHGKEHDKNGKKKPDYNSRGQASKWRRHYFRRRYPHGTH